MRVRYWGEITLFLIVTYLGLYLLSTVNYLLFHSLAEIFSIVIATSVFLLVWNARKYLKYNYLIFLGIAGLFIAVIDLAHMLAYKGMGVFPGDWASGTNLPAQLWIAARYLQGISFLVAPFFIRRHLRVKLLAFCYTVAVVLLLATIFYWRIFPVCFVEGAGLTSFKIISEYLISLILIGAAVLLYRQRSEFDQQTLYLLFGSIVVTIASELAFTFYIDVYGFSNMVGHYCKIIAFYLIYVAIIETGLMKPYGFLFRDLKIQQQALQFSQYALDHIADCVFWVGSAGGLKYANKSAQQTFGYTREEILLLDIWAINPQTTPQAWDRNWPDLKRKGTSLAEATFSTKNGKTFPAEVSANYVKFEEKEFNCLFVRDISDRKNIVRDLYHDIGKLEQFNKVMVDRETRVIGLKEEINRLCADLGREPAYPAVWLEGTVDDEG